MKHYISALLLVFALWGTAYSQTGSSDNSILLKSGKYINKIRIRNFDSLKVEYIKSGNLCDVKTTEVVELETDSGTVWFSESGHPISEQPTKVYTSDAVTVKDIPVTELPQVADSAGKEQNSPVKATESATEQFSQGAADYYHRSYEMGVEAAKRKDHTGWGIGTFLLGWMYGSPYLVSIATGNTVDPVDIPPGVDKVLYNEGYKKQQIIERSRAAATGSTIAKVTSTAFFFLLIFSSF